MIAVVIYSFIAWYAGGKAIDFLNSKERFVKFLEPLPQYWATIIKIAIYSIAFILSVLITNLIYILIAFLFK